MERDGFQQVRILERGKFLDSLRVANRAAFNAVFGQNLDRSSLDRVKIVRLRSVSSNEHIEPNFGVHIVVPGFVGQ